jgi:hypothetical protein
VKPHVLVVIRLLMAAWLALASGVAFGGGRIVWGIAACLLSISLAHLSIEQWRHRRVK